MSWLGTAFGWLWKKIAPALLPFIWNKINGAWKAYIERKRREKENRDASQRVLEQTQAAQSPKEREEALDADRYSL